MSVDEAKSNLQAQLDSQALAAQVTVSRDELEKLLDWADSASRTIGEFVAWANSCPANEEPPAVAPAEGGSGVGTLWIPESATLDDLVSALGPGEFPTIDQDMSEVVKSFEDGSLYPLDVDRVVQEGCRVVERDLASPRDEVRDSRAVILCRNEDEAESGVLVKKFAHCNVKGSKDQVRVCFSSDDVGSVEIHFGHQISLSVVGAPDGAGVGTSESTERGQTPTLSEKEMPSAVAPAEGDETKNQSARKV
ncbi:hypothetical protein [Glutamicibacter protophormiae]|uniref:DUF222 domain-containing protein n=1 Tax=Glutamicibacter protophormiae TaxID=37930 RepID=A0ABS4XQT4_GLUPR|nr:hypothetical protein [Glutamicibacter protophormiae]MBP2398874.1 hypothetical protein [Glutamicibacter protophormiae]GGL83212.1 hypothetical protein GCM10010038_11410 [Glutamicibacter protophormiae]